MAGFSGEEFVKINLGIGSPAAKAAATQWHPHFAWWPVYIKPYDYRWLETVERRAAWVGSITGTLYDVEYRPIEES